MCVNPTHIIFPDDPKLLAQQLRNEDKFKNALGKAMRLSFTSCEFFEVLLINHRILQTLSLQAQLPLRLPVKLLSFSLCIADSQTQENQSQLAIIAGFPLSFLISLQLI